MHHAVSMQTMQKRKEEKKKVIMDAVYTRDSHASIVQPRMPL